MSKNDSPSYAQLLAHEIAKGNKTEKEVHASLLYHEAWKTVAQVKAELKRLRKK